MSSLPGPFIPIQPQYPSGPFKASNAPAFAGTSCKKTEQPLVLDPGHQQPGNDAFQSAPASSPAHHPAQNATPENSSATNSGRNGVFGDKARLATGFILEDVVPPLLGFAFMTGPLGWLVTLGSLPLSYASGKLGRRIASGIKPEHLPPAMKSFQNFREGFRNKENLQGQYDLLEKWNVFIDDALNVRSGHAKMIGGLLGGYLKISKDGKIGQILSSKQFLKANVYHNVAQANTVGGAIKAGAKGGMGFWFYNGFLPGAGLALEKGADLISGPLKLPLNGLGWLLKNMALLRLGKDMLAAPKSH